MVDLPVALAAAVSRAAACFCTLAIHAPYRERARALCADLVPLPVVVLTDEPAAFAGLPVRAIRHAPTGPMAADYLARLGHTGQGRGAAAYHDKRFALRAALEGHETAIFLDADTRVGTLSGPGAFPAGIAVVPLVRRSVAEHLALCGAWRLPAFEDLARALTGGVGILHEARWCHETPLAVTGDGREERFFEAWGRAAGLLQSWGVFSGEGGVIGIASSCAGWTVDYDALAGVAAAIRHEGGGPKVA